MREVGWADVALMLGRDAIATDGVLAASTQNLGNYRDSSQCGMFINQALFCLPGTTIPELTLAWSGR